MPYATFDEQFKKLNEKLEKKNEEYNKKIQIEILRLQSGKFEKNKDEYIQILKNQIIQLENEKLQNNKISKNKIANYFENEEVSEINKIKLNKKWKRFICFLK